MDKKIVVSLGVDTSGVTKGMRKAQTEVNQGTTGIAGGFKKATSGIGKFVSGVGKIAGALGVFKLLDSAISMVTQGIDRGISRFDTLNRFPKIMEQYNVSAEQAKQSISRLSDGIEGLPTTLDGIVGSVQQLVPIVGSLERAEGVALAFNNALVAAGASTADASRATTQYNQMLSTGKVDMMGWRSLMETMPGPLKQVAEEMLGTGSNAQDLYNALQSGEITLEEFNNKMIEMSEATGGFADQAKEAAGGIRNSFENLKNSVAVGVASILETLNEWSQSTTGKEISEHIDGIKYAIRDFFDTINQHLPGVLDGFTELWNTISNSTAFQTFGEVTELLNGKFTELKENIGDSGAFQTLIDMFEDLGDALLNIDFTSLMEGLSLIIDVLGIVLVYVLWNVVGQLKFLYEAIKVVGTIFGDVFNYIAEWFEKNGEPIKEAINSLFDSEEMGLSLEEMAEKVMTAWDGIKETVFSAVGLILEIIKLFLSVLTGDWESAWESIKAILSRAWDIIVSIQSRAISIVWNTIKSKLSSIKSTWDNTWKAIGNFLKSTWESIKSSVSNGINNIRTKVNSGLTAIQNFFTSKWNAIKSTVSNSISSMISTVKSKIGQFRQAGSDLITGLWNGIKGMFSSVTGWVGDLAQGLVNKVKGVFGVKSPSRVFHQIGEFLMQGFMGGIDNLSGKAMSQMKSFAKNIIGEADGIAPKVSDTLNGLNPEVNFKGNTTLDAYLDKLKDRDYTPVVHVHVSDGDIYLDGEKVGKQVAPTVKQENDKVKGMKDRSKGINNNFGGVFG